ncbi:MAG: hypothetical protein ABW178_03300, partial [Pseudoxanthomonas sp.]
MSRIDTDVLAASQAHRMRPGVLDRLLRQRLLQTLDGLHGGTLVVQEGADQTTLGARKHEGDLHARLTVRDPAFYR